MFKEYLNQYRTIITENNPNNGICYDGAVDPSRYFSKRNRLMFLLKETNGNNNNGEHNEILADWDYMEWVCKQADGSEPLYRSVYRNIAMWSKMFNVYANENRELEESEFLDNGSIIIDTSLLDSLRDVAIVNLKKSWGVEQTDWYQMREYLEDTKRKEILLYQMEELKPTIVLCGGTFDFALQLWGKDTEMVEKVTASGQIVSCFIKSETIFVQCYHPSRPGWSRLKSFEHMKNIFDAIM